MAEKHPSIMALASEALRRLFADEAIPLAGNIAFRTIFSIFPFLIFMTTLAGFVGSEDLAQRVVNFLLGVAPEKLVAPLVPEIRSILTVQRKGLAGVAALVTVWSAMGGIDCLRVALNRAYDLKEHRGIFKLYALELLFVISAVFGLLAVALLIVFSPVAFNVIESFAPGFRQNFATIDQLRYPIAIVLLTAGLQACHRILPAKRLSPVEVLPGVVLTVAVWILLSSAFSAYLVNFNTFASTYASLSGVFAAMFFVYLAALVLILGGEVNRVLAVHREARATIDADPDDELSG